MEADDERETSVREGSSFAVRDFLPLGVLDEDTGVGGDSPDDRDESTAAATDSPDGGDEGVSRLTLDRRSLLKATGAVSVAAVAGIASLWAADSATPEYEEITVGAGETYTARVHSGETFENKLIDISASGATFDIEANGADWVVRNVGIKGVWDQYQKAEPFRARVDAGGTGLIENFYFADGCPDDEYDGVTGIYVYRTHGGDLTINQTNIQDLPDNAIYASTPGYPRETVANRLPGKGGTVTIKNSYAEGCCASHFRVGTTGSRVENCVAVGGDQGDRGIWARFNDIEVANCHLTGHARGDVACGTFEWPAGLDARVSVVDTYFETTDLGLFYRGTVLGLPTGSPEPTMPPIPTSAEAAAQGIATRPRTGTTDS
ncbi:hypothetical protein ACFQJC_17940 [Haloferax namakaokahaiae]|uniref:Twin-arginine translocation signal domain-containing protein n=1 Tax=Haloferax namakaokahaiae TaxID=1748331 RepID=A0ABD5ZJD2_9EURY